MTYEGRHAMQKISEAIASISFALEELSEPALKGLAFELRREAALYPEEDAVRTGIAEQADKAREIRKRHRTGKGTWFALVDVMQWNRERTQAQSVKTIAEKCEGKDAAIARGRTLLAENANLFSEHTSVEASVRCDLEYRPNWDQDN